MGCIKGFQTVDTWVTRHTGRHVVPAGFHGFLRWLSVWVFFLKKLFLVLTCALVWHIPGSRANMPQLGSLLGDRRVGGDNHLR